MPWGSETARPDPTRELDRLRWLEVDAWRVVDAARLVLAEWVHTAGPLGATTVSALDALSASIFHLERAGHRPPLQPTATRETSR